MTAAAMAMCERRGETGPARTGLAPKPFLKWAGGKRKLVPKLLEVAPKSFGTYYEPFLGGGALFFALAPERAVLGDANHRLIRTYSAVRDSVEDVIDLLRRSPNTKEDFEREREFRVDEADDVRAAAWFIYLNRTAFNGLYRVNADGEFNTPFGKYKNPAICDEPTLRAASRALRSAEVRCGDFEAVCATAQAGDLVYFDPPYMPTSTTSKFTNYTSGGFGLKDHARLRDVALELKRRGVHVVISNSAAPEVLGLYAQGFRITRVVAPRAIAANGAKRGSVGELIIT